MNDNTIAALNAIFKVDKPVTEPVTIDVTPVVSAPATEVPEPVIEPDPTPLVPVSPVQQALDAVQQPVEPTQDEKDLDEDFEYSRGLLKSLAEDGQSTFARAADVAQQLDNPRNFEAAAAILKATIEVHRELTALHKNRADVKAAKNANTASGGNVNIKQGIVFQGNPTDILKQLKPERS